MTKSMIDDCRNVFGPLDAECRARLRAVLENPTEETWDAASSLIVGKDGFTTLWQAWVKVDPGAPLSGCRYDAETGDKIRGWQKIPDQLTLYRALKEVTKP